MKAYAVVLHICGPKDIAYFYTTDYSLHKVDVVTRSYV